jgi:hypothetical protein
MAQFNDQNPGIRPAAMPARFAWTLALSFVLLVISGIQTVRAVRQYTYGVSRGTTWSARTFTWGSRDAFEGWTSRRGAYLRSTRAEILAAVGLAIPILVFLGNMLYRRRLSPWLGISGALLVVANAGVVAYVVHFWIWNNIPSPVWD